MLSLWRSHAWAGEVNAACVQEKLRRDGYAWMILYIGAGPGTLGWKTETETGMHFESQDH